MNEDTQVRCGDGCKRAQPTADAATQAGWTFLDIGKRWRCTDCVTELAIVNAQIKPRYTAALGLNTTKD